MTKEELEAYWLGVQEESNRRDLLPNAKRPMIDLGSLLIGFIAGIFLTLITISAIAQPAKQWRVTNGRLVGWTEQYGWDDGRVDPVSTPVDRVTVVEDSVVRGGPIEGMYKQTAFPYFRVAITRRGSKYVMVVMQPVGTWQIGEVRAYIEDAGLRLYPCTMWDYQKGKHEDYALWEDGLLHIGREAYLRLL